MGLGPDGAKSSSTHCASSVCTRTCGASRTVPKAETFFWSSVTPRSFIDRNREAGVISRSSAALVVFRVSGDGPELYDKRGLRALCDFTIDFDHGERGKFVSPKSMRSCMSLIWLGT